MDAAVDGPEVVRIDDLRTDSRWPQWSRRAAELGWRSVLSATLGTETEIIGSLNLYAREVARYDGSDEDVAILFARHATAALAPALEIAGLRKAMDTRLMIGRAEGIVMERYNLSGDEAFRSASPLVSDDQPEARRRRSDRHQRPSTHQRGPNRVVRSEFVTSIRRCSTSGSASFTWTVWWS